MLGSLSHIPPSQLHSRTCGTHTHTRTHTHTHTHTHTQRQRHTNTLYISVTRVLCEHVCRGFFPPYIPPGRSKPYNFLPTWLVSELKIPHVLLFPRNSCIQDLFSSRSIN